MMIQRPGELRVSLQPRHSGDSIGIIIVLEDSIGRVLDRYNMQDVTPPLIVKGPVQPGPPELSDNKAPLLRRDWFFASLSCWAPTLRQRLR